MGNSASLGEGLWNSCRHGELAKVREFCETKGVSNKNHQLYKQSNKSQHQVDELWNAALDYRDSSSGTTPLMISCQARSDSEILNLLIQSGANVNARNNINGQTVLHYAVESRRLSHIEVLLSYGADVTIRSDKRLNAIEFARKLNLLEIIRLLENSISLFSNWLSLESHGDIANISGAILGSKVANLITKTIGGRFVEKWCVLLKKNNFEELSIYQSNYHTNPEFIFQTKTANLIINNFENLIFSVFNGNSFEQSNLKLTFQSKNNEIFNQFTNAFNSREKMNNDIYNNNLHDNNIPIAFAVVDNQPNQLNQSIQSIQSNQLIQLNNSNNSSIENKSIHDLNEEEQIRLAIEISKKDININSLNNQFVNTNDNIIPSAPFLVDENDINLTDNLSINNNKIIPNAFICPLTNGIMNDPVICADGYTYERIAIETYLKTNSYSPKTNLLLEHKIIIPNITLRAAIQEFNYHNN